MQRTHDEGIHTPDGFQEVFLVKRVQNMINLYFKDGRILSKIYSNGNNITILLTPTSYGVEKFFDNFFLKNRTVMAFSRNNNFENGKFQFLDHLSYQIIEEYSPPITTPYIYMDAAHYTRDNKVIVGFSKVKNEGITNLGIYPGALLK